MLLLCLGRVYFELTKSKFPIESVHIYIYTDRYRFIIRTHNIPGYYDSLGKKVFRATGLMAGEWKVQESLSVQAFFRCLVHGLDPKFRNPIWKALD